MTHYVFNFMPAMIAAAEMAARAPIFELPASHPVGKRRQYKNGMKNKARYRKTGRSS